MTNEPQSKKAPSARVADIMATEDVFECWIAGRDKSFVKLKRSEIASWIEWAADAASLHQRIVITRHKQGEYI